MYIYSVGIIDYLQHYNNEKHMEHLYKEWRQTGHSMEMSAVPPKFYSKRFFDFMSKQVIVNQVTKDHKSNKIKYNHKVKKEWIMKRNSSKQKYI